MTETVALLQPFENFPFNVPVVKSNHEINLLTLFLCISHPTRPNLRYSFLSYQTVSHCSRLFRPAFSFFSLLGTILRWNLNNQTCSYVV